MNQKERARAAMSRLREGIKSSNIKSVVGAAAGGAAGVDAGKYLAENYSTALFGNVSQATAICAGVAIYAARSNAPIEIRVALAAAAGSAYRTANG